MGIAYKKTRRVFAGGERQHLPEPPCVISQGLKALVLSYCHPDGVEEHASYQIAGGLQWFSWRFRIDPKTDLRVWGGGGREKLRDLASLSKPNKRVTHFQWAPRGTKIVVGNFRLWGVITLGLL